MSRTTKIFLILVTSGVLFVTAGVGIAAAAVVYRSGSIGLEVRGSGGGSDRISVSVPAGLARIAIALAPVSLVDEALVEVRPFLPAARAGWDELTHAPDFVLVEVSGPDEQVRVEKKGRYLVVRVDSSDENVSVRVPLGTVEALLSKLDRGTPRG